jgi:hypothetical protein
MGFELKFDKKVYFTCKIINLHAEYIDLNRINYQIFLMISLKKPIIILLFLDSPISSSFLCLNAISYLMQPDLKLFLDNN